MHISVLAVLASILLMGCQTVAPVYGSPPAEAEKSLLSYAMVKKLLKPGVTTQAEVLKAFGSPNNMALNKDGGELWIYDQITTYSESEISSSGASIIVAGSSASSSRNRSATQTLTVILDFDRTGTLIEHSARVGGY
jgi:hypothetical protein